MSFSFRAHHVGDRSHLNYFPYIGDDGGNLRLWDVAEGRDISIKIRRRRREGGYPHGYTADEVRRRFPDLYTLAHSEGFWGDT